MAYGKACQKCHKKHHFDFMCRSESGTKAIDGDMQGALFDQLCSIQNGCGRRDDMTSTPVTHDVRASTKRPTDLDHHL